MRFSIDIAGVRCLLWFPRVCSYKFLHIFKYHTSVYRLLLCLLIAVPRAMVRRTTFRRMVKCFDDSRRQVKITRPDTTDFYFA